MKRQIFLIPAILVGLGFCWATPRGHAGEVVTSERITLNKVAVEYARELIAKGQIIDDKRGSWREDQPSSADENEFIRQRGWDEYARWHLGMDERYPEHSKARYKFPCGDFKKVHRCALLAAGSRAAQFGHQEIRQAATHLLETITAGKAGRESR